MPEETSGTKDKAKIRREYRLRPKVFSQWREEIVERASETFAAYPGRGDEQERIAALERMVRQLTMELEAAKESRRCFASDNILTSLSNGKGR